MIKLKVVFKVYEGQVAGESDTTRPEKAQKSDLIRVERLFIVEKQFLVSFPYYLNIRSD